MSRRPHGALRLVSRHTAAPPAGFPCELSEGTAVLTSLPCPSPRPALLPPLRFQRHLSTFLCLFTLATLLHIFYFIPFRVLPLLLQIIHSLAARTWPLTLIILQQEVHNMWKINIC